MFAVCLCLGMCLGSVFAPPAKAQTALSSDESYHRIIGELYPDETPAFIAFYASLDAYDRYALARIIERLDKGEWGLFAQLLAQTDRPTAIKTLRLFGGYNDEQLTSVTRLLKEREFKQWQAVPVLVGAVDHADARDLLLGDDAQNPCAIRPEGDEIGDEIGGEIDADAPAARLCSEAEAQFIETFFLTSVPRVTRGVLAKPNEIPWQVQFSLHGASTRASYSQERRNQQIERFGRRLEDWEINHTCGAVYLGAKFVLTAAHCIGTLKDSKFFAGRRVHLGSVKIDGERNLFEIENVLVHADFRRGTLQNDIALIQLSRVPTGFRRALRSVTPARTPAEASESVSLLLSGWGYNRPATSSGDIFALDGQRQARAQPSLLKGNVWVKEISACRSNRHFRRRKIDIYPGQICVGSPRGVDSCRGDSGGPLVNPRSETLIGLVSGSAGCGLRATPSIFTDVGYYRDWIDRAKAAAPRLRGKRKHQFR